MTLNMRDVLVRKMQNADLPRILQLLADDELGQLRETLETTPHDDYRRAFTAIDADSNQYLAVFEKDDNIIGCLQISFIPGLSRRGALRGQIESVRVAANVRGNGYGTLMMAWAIEKCREQGCSLVQLTSDKTRKDANVFIKSLVSCLRMKGSSFSFKHATPQFWFKNTVSGNFELTLFRSWLVF